MNLSQRSGSASQHGPDSDPYDRAKKALKDEWISGLTGVFLALFMWGHMLFVSSILIGEQTFDFVADLFEDTW
ncbi:MAG: hypothetical protein QF669_07795, partial [Candidatus Marinimicrobia bacterium]|nr:hypothetical protein [Candidatus Neomarinimicrobiota bacterium]